MKDVVSHLLHYLDKQASIIKVLIDKEGVIIHANAFTEKLAGKPLQAMPVQSLFTEFNANLKADSFLSDELNYTMLNVNTHSTIPETFYFTSFKVPEGMLLIGEADNAETEELRQNMISLNNELNNMARDLQKKNIQLEQLNQLKNQFLGIAAHDLRNPIASIIMFSEFLLESEDHTISDELRKMIEAINKSSEFMLKLLEDLLDVVKIESGKLQLNIETTDIEDLLRNNIGVNALLAGKKEIKLVLNVPETLPAPAIDPIKIEQVLNNLISNAIKYSHKQTKVTISAVTTGDHILISVQDQGQGIPKNELDKVFTPFSQISVVSTAGEKSTGLGLSIVKRIIVGHLGRIWVESDPDGKSGEKGTTFYFTLPINRKTS
ncbi:MAG: HAMP domain-containing sensor histidine kinase [Bacteroidetes bacterium]|jgi:signal transduction histidine kinase|nr:HAMP domain-containing sensor histidine kinase [Bacteroidota bacterium]